MPTEPPQIAERPSRRWLLASILLAVLYQAILVATSPAIQKDGITFISLAKDMTVSPVQAMRQYDQHPGYPLMILAGRTLVLPLVRPESLLSWIWGARLVSGVFGVLVIAAVWLLARRVFDRRAADVAAILVAVLPLFRENASDVLSDTPHLFFYVLAVWLLIEGLTRRGWWWFVWAGMSSGLAYWIRPEGLSVVIVGTAVLLLWGWQRRIMPPAKVLSCVSALLIAGAAVSVPYPILSGKFSSKITNKEYLQPAPAVGERAVPVVLAVLQARDTSVEERGKQVASPPKPAGPVAHSTPTAGGTAQDHDAGFLQVVWAGISLLARDLAQGLRWVLLVPLFLPLALRVLMVLGVRTPASPRSREEARVLVIGLIVFHALLLSWLFYAGRYISQRHIMTSIMILMPWVASVVIFISEKLSTLLDRRDEQWVEKRARLILGVLLLALVAVITPRTLRPLHSGEIPVIETSTWLSVQAKPGDQVISNSPYVSFFAQMPGRVITRSDADAGKNLSDVGLPYRFAVFDLNEDPFVEEWLAQLSGRYEPLPVIGVPGSAGRIVVLRLKAPGGQ
jgi:hypothetical protein